MENPLISIRTARLAYEKGYKKDCYREHPPRNYGKVPQAVLQKWLREEHNIHIVSKPFYDSKFDKTTIVADVIRINDGTVRKSPQMDTYERALETSLETALELITV